MSKFTVTFKDPDTFYDATRDQAELELKGVEGIDDGEREELIQGRSDKIREACEDWIEYGEYVRIEFDTDAGTATVLKVKS